MPLVINSLGGGHTDTQTHTRTRILTHGPKQFQETKRAQPSAMRAWFKNAWQHHQQNLYGEDTVYGKSLTYKLKSRGPRVEPCGTLG